MPVLIDLFDLIGLVMCIRYDQIARKVRKMMYRQNHLISTCHLWLFIW